MGLNSPMEEIKPVPDKGPTDLGFDATCSGGRFHGHPTVPCQELKHGPVPNAGVGGNVAEDGDLRMKK